VRVAPRRNQVRNRLTAGGNRIRTIGPALVKGLSAVADERCRADKLDGVIKHRSSRETTMVGRLLRGDPRPTACRHSPRPNSSTWGPVSLAETFGSPGRVHQEVAHRAVAFCAGAGNQTKASARSCIVGTIRSGWCGVMPKGRRRRSMKAVRIPADLAPMQSKA